MSELNLPYATQYFQASYGASQAGTELIPAPSNAEQRIVVEQAIVSTDCDSVAFSFDQGADPLLPNQFLGGPDTWNSSPNFNLQLNPGQALTHDSTVVVGGGTEYTVWIAYHIQ